MTPGPCAGSERAQIVSSLIGVSRVASPRKPRTGIMRTERSMSVGAPSTSDGSKRSGSSAGGGGLLRAAACGSIAFSRSVPTAKRIGARALDTAGKPVDPKLLVQALDRPAAFLVAHERLHAPCELAKCRLERRVARI